MVDDKQEFEQILHDEKRAAEALEFVGITPEKFPTEVDVKNEMIRQLRVPLGLPGDEK